VSTGAYRLAQMRYVIDQFVTVCGGSAVSVPARGGMWPAPGYRRDAVPAG